MALGFVYVSESSEQTTDAVRGGKHLPVVFTASCVPSLPLPARVPLPGLGGSDGMAFPAGASFSWLAGPALALGATAGLGGSLG